MASAGCFTPIGPGRAIGYIRGRVRQEFVGRPRSFRGRSQPYHDPRPPTPAGYRLPPSRRSNPNTKTSLCCKMVPEETREAPRRHPPEVSARRACDGQSDPGSSCASLRPLGRHLGRYSPRADPEKRRHTNPKTLNTTRQRWMTTKGRTEGARPHNEKQGDHPSINLWRSSRRTLMHRPNKTPPKYLCYISS